MSTRPGDHDGRLGNRSGSVQLAEATHHRGFDRVEQATQAAQIMTPPAQADGVHRAHVGGEQPVDHRGRIHAEA